LENDQVLTGFLELLLGDGQITVGAHLLGLAAVKGFLAGL
jgi:hypothetical protein